MGKMKPIAGAREPPNGKEKTVRTGRAFARSRPTCQHDDEHTPPEERQRMKNSRQWVRGRTRKGRNEERRAHVDV